MSLWNAWLARPLDAPTGARREFLDGRVVLHVGDSLEILDGLEPNSIDSVVTDPPYHLTSVVKRFGPDGAAPARHGTDGLFARQSRGFMNQTWDGGDIAFQPLLWAKVLRVLKPGGHMVAFSGTRTYHRMACAIEDAGFEIRDQLAFCYGTGFPKSLNISKGIDKAAGAVRESAGNRLKNYADTPSGYGSVSGKGGTRSGGIWSESKGDVQSGREVTLPSTDAARQWDGWGTALKPAWEPICLARKPLSEGTVVANVLAHGTGGLNVDGCRIACDDKTPFPVGAMSADGSIKTGLHGKPRGEDTSKNGRFPANLCHDGSPEVLAGFPESKSVGGSGEASKNWKGTGDTVGANLAGATGGFGDSGSAARFFYCAKASKKDRAGSRHPTIKPVALMRWLARLVTPPGGTLLDPFAGSGTTGQAAHEEGFRAVLCEREAEYAADIAERMRRLSEP